MTWRNHWNRKLEGWVERRRRFRKTFAGKIGGLKMPELFRRTVPNKALDPREVR